MAAVARSGCSIVARWAASGSTTSWATPAIALLDGGRPCPAAWPVLRSADHDQVGAVMADLVAEVHPADRRAAAGVALIGRGRPAAGTTSTIRLPSASGWALNQRAVMASTSARCPSGARSPPAPPSGRVGRVGRRAAQHQRRRPARGRGRRATCRPCRRATGRRRRPGRAPAVEQGEHVAPEVGELVRARRDGRAAVAAVVVAQHAEPRDSAGTCGSHMAAVRADGAAQYDDRRAVGPSDS